MNYANMIEEKHLKKGFVVATLISTIVGTLTASMTLHDKVQEKRDKKKQKAVDAKQTGEIERLRKKVEAVKSGHDSVDETESSGSRSRSQYRRRRRRSWEEDDFAYESRRSRAMIERMYEDHLMRAGDRYATGDMITENRLQTQIIKLQQTVINVLQDALCSGRGLTETDQRRLIAAQSAARDGSLDALQDHYARISTRKRRETLPNPTPRLLLPPASASNDDDQSSHHLPRKLSPLPTTVRPLHSTPPRSSYSPDPALFCPYSIHLQTTAYPLPPPTNRTEQSLTCPTCHVRIPVSARDYWILSTTSPHPPSSSSCSPHHHRPLDEEADIDDDDFFPLSPSSADSPSYAGKQEWKLTARFLVKSHTPEGDFVCLVCEREGGRRGTGGGGGGGEVCVARSVEALVRHLGRWHVG
ncbi:hypothetical protein KC366_g15113 [Hortaea werneckii]|uniref:Uncharacterized protein n=1 Tax=Hortaea werneckii EXF-2000 TaxID=1157616 RepID=A0A1Z5TJZ3_HORWE|nr:hypothetical protein KC358_g14872 [Hortaea werneckii]OTA36308.1 hypothetical protein BTJ68_04535 [Hortaea werneckii EXF-2000]KAI6805512.1 hypothetical protein KC350_g14537 [Hortaea werneckii]KAI6923607.1 hypothetical protein KC341_g14607 [Hortaea werneckii]KAI7016430.1 hypothetical protein KC366_g15113 [Hortaea werneckii]